MSSLYRKYRPQNFSQLSGQAHIVRTLSGAIAKNRIGHAYLFTGPRGTGKTTTARIFAKAINCLDLKKNTEKNSSALSALTEPCNECTNCLLIKNNKAIDLMEIDAASNTGVDNIRQLKESIPLPPSALKYKIYIIDEVHMLSMGAFNALLKTLEEPPAHAIFILATTEIQKVPETILSRCQRFDFARLSHEQIVERLKNLAEQEKVAVENEVFQIIAFEAEGGMRDAESIFGQILSLEDKKIAVDLVEELLGVSSKGQALEFVELLIKGEIEKVLIKIAVLQEQGIHLKNFNKAILAYLRNLLLIKSAPKIATKLNANLTQTQQAQAFELTAVINLGSLLFLTDCFQKSLTNLKFSPFPQLPLEMAAIEWHLFENKSFLKTTNPLPEASSPKKPSSSSTVDRALDTENSEKKSPETLSTDNSEEKTLPFSSSLLQNNENFDEKKQAPDLEENVFDKADELSICSSFAGVLNHWNTIVDEAKNFNTSLHAILRHCVPLTIQDGKLYIKTKYTFNKNKLNDQENRLTIQKIIAKILQCRLQVCYICENEIAEMNFQQTAEKEDLGILHDAMQILGGRIIKEEL